MSDHLQINPMMPYLGTLVEVKDIATEIKMFKVAMQNGGGEAFRDYRPGQFAFVSSFGVGEAPFGIANIPQNGEPILDFAINRLGSVTADLHELGVGDTVGVRGPMGNGFPMEKFKDKNLVVIGGGIGGAPLRPVIQAVMAHRNDYRDFIILWAARNPSLLVFTDEYDQWRATPNTELHLTVDQGDETWKDNVGLITQLLEKVAPSPRNTITITCGPPIMIHFVNRVLVDKLNFKPEQNYVTLEARMHCGIGKCGRCNLGSKLICVDGPVFTMAEVGTLLESFL
jgi:sulfhydrogenase subunit gamma (sulfur reductase)